MLILGIETSCDETAAALVRFDRGRFDIISNIVSSQVKIHSKYGGIVPEVAARNHVVNIIPVVEQALEEFKGEVTIKRLKETRPSASSHSGLRASGPRTAGSVENKKQETKGANDLIDAIAVTNGPGLITSLLVGVETAKALAYAWDKPLIAINHLEGHIYSVMKIRDYENMKINDFNFPALALIVSGGHTQLVLMTDYGRYRIIGETRDDAAGEAFDKVAKLLGLGYPGGPVIAVKADECQKIGNKKQDLRQAQILSKTRNKDTKKLQITSSKYQINLPRPMIDSKDFDFSFSGLKTAVLYETRNKKQEIRNKKLGKKYISKMCAEFQQAVIDVLTAKTLKAAKKYKVKNVILAGGVSANKSLRERFKKEFGNKLLLPGPGLSTDNAVMIAMAGVRHFRERNFIELNKIKVDPNLTL
ncbi:tRNA (adenosine(37)-N6)-threonylcarbamoyltransferase complex transferase subunit TsaD [Patescibacteria group bacterium]|nr:tRNA (adenosine(37)-N6)-threonylcarbamoyltransferase complex transferase subunit TsaD [Patescibacteria group bacterium]MBU4511760.1 tRNA (adenosine(37)-N6)-threonylcarbamoyltransferase complex transferase subunit TsaD [Patescibacteria group bacterium]